MDTKTTDREFTLRFGNLLLRRDKQNLWEIVEVTKNQTSENYEKLAYWNQDKDLIYCNSRHLDSDISYDFIKIEYMTERWLLQKGVSNV